MKKRKILDLRPTQFAVGMLEIDEKIEIVRAYDKKKLRAYIEEHRVPIVISPDGDMYIVDHHHFLCVCLHTGIKKVYVEVRKDFSKNKTKMSYETFWKWMIKNKNIYPYCQFGQGPRHAIYLPRDIRGVADDPYRSLAWFVRKAGAFEKSERNFAEFKWANFFRKRRLLEKHGLTEMHSALEKAAKLAQSKHARRLPGYGKLNLADKVEAVEDAKRKGREIAKSAAE